MAGGRAPAGAQALEAVLLGGVRALSANDLAQQAGVDVEFGRLVMPVNSGVVRRRIRASAAAAEPCSQRFQW